MKIGKVLMPRIPDERSHKRVAQDARNVDLDQGPCQVITL
jgi:hypothetical protein